MGHRVLLALDQFALTGEAVADGALADPLAAFEQRR